MTARLTAWMKARVRPLIALFLCTIAYNAIGHSVGQLQTTKFLAPETVQLLISRAGSGTPGLQVGDIISYIIQFTPVANGATNGVAGYVTDYIPPGTEVVGASVVQPSGSSYIDVSPSLPGSIDNGWSGGQNTYLAAPFNTNAFDATGLCATNAPGPVFTNNCNGSVAQVYADTGIFYSTDSRTAQFPVYPTRIRQGTNGYNVTPTAAGQLNPLIGQTQATTHNLWDANQTNAFGSTQGAINGTLAPKSGQVQISSSGRHAAPFGAGSAVAGPQSGFTLDDTGSLGPWQRIAYFGSRIGTTSTGPATATATTKFETTADTMAVKGSLTSAGVSLSPSTPLPPSTNAVRWAVGGLNVGQNKYVKISLRLTAPVPAGGLINGSEVFGGDAAGTDNGNDSTWRYHVPSVADNNSNLYVLKEIVAVNGVASNGSTVPPNAKIRYRITYLNSGNSTQTNVVLSDTLPSQTGAGSVSAAIVVTGPNILPFSPASPAGGGTITFQAIASLASGVAGAVEFDVQTNAGNGSTVSNLARVVSSELPAPGVTSNAVSSVQNMANLQISKTVTPANISPGGTPTYTITVANSGAAAASSIVINDFLPTAGGALNANTRFNFVMGSSVIAGIASVTPTVVAPPTITPYTSDNRQQVTWTFGASLAAGASFTIQFQASAGSLVPASASAYTNDAQVSYNAGVSTAAATAPVFVGNTLSGVVFEDINYGGGAGRSLSSSGGVVRPNVRVELYDSAGTFLRTTTTDTAGAYSFNGLAGGNYFVRVVSATVQSSRFGGSSCSACVPVQTFRVDASSGAAVADPNRVGGENPALVDAGNGSTTLAGLASASTTAQSIVPVTVGSVNITGLDFGFNFDTIVSTRDSGQGSLRQFILNSNALSNSGLAQVGQSTGREVSIFMVPDGAAHPGLRAGLVNQLVSGVASIVPMTALPAISDANTTIDGTTQTANVGDTNAGVFGTGGSVGVSSLSLPTVNRPEVQIADGAASLAIGVDLQASGAVIRGVAVVGFGNAANSNGNANIRIGASGSGALIENSVIGSFATSFADPGASARSGGDNIRAEGATGGTLRNSLIAYSSGKGVGLENGSNSWSVTGNEIRGNGIGNANLDGIAIEGSNSASVTGNLVMANEGVGIDSFNSSGANLFQNNTVTGNGIGSGALVETSGVRVYGASNNIALNIINANFGAGVMVASSASANLISRNSIFANGTITNKVGGGPSGQIGIDLLSATDAPQTGTAPFVTLNDAGDADVGGNGLLNYPVLSGAAVQGANLLLTGFARPGSTIELFIADPDASGFGEGKTYLVSLVEGSAQDTDATTGLYGPTAVNGIAQGTDITNRFSFLMPLPAGVGAGTRLTATATLAGATSEFSGNVAASLAPPAIAKAFSPASVGISDQATLTFTLTNPNTGVALSGVAFSDTYPAGLLNATPAGAVSTCGGTLTAGDGANSVSLTGAAIAAGGSCLVTVNVSSATAGTYNNTSGSVTSTNGGIGNTASATLTVLQQITVVKSFSPVTIAPNATSVLTILLTNPNGTAITGAAFADTYPAGLVNTASASGATTCVGGTVTAANGGSSVALASGTVPANGSCTVSVNVTSAAAGAYNNSTGPVTSTNAGTAAAGSATLTVVSPDLRLTKTHSGNFTVGVQGAYTLIVNNTLGSASTSATITVVDTLPTGLSYVSAGSGGTGWTCAAAGQVVTCTSSTVIAAGAASANPITINVSVAAVAVPTVTNSATVSGGGELAAQAGNNAAFDPTAVVVAGQSTFQPDGAQTALPGTTVFYPHTFNTSLAGTVAFSTSNVPTPAAGGWNNVIYRDSNCNGVLDGAEGSAPLASSINVNPGDTVCIVIKEFVPASAPYNANDVITVTATFTPASGPVASHTRTDTTTVGNPGGAGLSLTKTVRNVTTSGSAGTANAAKPGETLEYTVAYSNNSADPLATIIIHDATPAFTAFVSASCSAPLPANVTACNVTTQPASGAAGGIAWTFTGSLASTQAGTVTFRVTVQ